jgi:hypothetical protein
LAFRSFAINTNPEREGEKGETASDPEDKPKDKEQLYGDPGEVKEEGYKETKIGEDGKATTQRQIQIIMLLNSIQIHMIMRLLGMAIDQFIANQ